MVPLRTLVPCSERTGQMAPIEFDILLQEEIIDPLLKGEINELLARKKDGEE